MRKLTIISIAILMIISGCTIIAHGQDINTETYNIELTTNDDSISVVEKITIDTDSGDIILIWIQSGHRDISFVINDSVITISPSTNTYSFNLTELGLTSANYIEIRYTLDKDTDEFEKIFQYNTTLISITFDGTEIYTGSNLIAGSSLNVALQQDQTIIETEKIETIPTWYYIIIAILIILLLMALLSSSKKQKTSKKKEITGGSEELLNTKKTLLMSLLKDIEKQHRSKQISDDTYHKLKEQYKQEAVEAMKQLEDMKSKIK